jgi:CrcB protein
MKETLWVGLGGLFGAIARYWMAALLYFGPAFPLARSSSISGSFLLGFLMGFSEVRSFSPQLRLSVAVGFIGAYTTFSTWTFESLALFREGDSALGLLNLFGSLVLGMAFVLLGFLLGRAV